MRRITIALVTLMFLLVATTGVSLAKQVNATASRTITGKETIHLPAALCSQLQQNAQRAHKLYAHDPRLCTMTHSWREVLVPDSPTQLSLLSTALASGSPTGKTYFYDYNYSDLDLWEMDLDTGFQWNGDCSAPTFVNVSGHASPYCWVAFTIMTTVTEQKCYSYYTNLPSHAAVYSGLITEDAVVQFPTSQRRECYEAYNNCNWTQWDGW